MEQPLRLLRKLLRPLRAKTRLLSLLLLLTFTVKAQTGLMAIVEVTNGAPEGPVASKALIKLCLRYQVPLTDVYQWRNHLVAYGPKTQIRQLVPALKKAYARASIKIYDAPFYKFDRQWCTDKTVSRQWDNILLTANLVADPTKQQEYLRYHATQFELWPEVAAGFCQASFQQLLVFRNERQLMLVISIPKGASLDELNPKTTENNPRVDKWNALMQQYQEGIPGTKPGEVWVFLKPVAAPMKITIKQ